MERYTDVPKCNVCGRAVELLNDIARDLCRDCGQEIHQTLLLWNEASSWDDLLRLSRQFIRGTIRFTPGHYGPLDPESTPLVLNFLCLHDFGFITTNSQPERYELCPTISGTWGVLQQRPYLDAIIPSFHRNVSMSALEMLVTKLIQHPDLMATVYCEYHKYPLQSEGLDDGFFNPQDAAAVPACECTFTATEKSLYRFRSTALRGPIPPCVTREKEANTRLELETAPWRYCTSFPTVDTQSLMGEHGAALGLQNKQGNHYAKIIEKVVPIVIHIAARKWDAGMLLEPLLLDLCVEVGMKPLFAED